MEHLNAEGYTGSTLPGRFAPECDLDGNYKPLQCLESSGVCWCVDSQGQEIPGTRGREKKQCITTGRLLHSFYNPLVLYGKGFEMFYCRPSDSNKNEAIAISKRTDR